MCEKIVRGPELLLHEKMVSIDWCSLGNGEWLRGKRQKEVSDGRRIKEKQKVCGYELIGQRQRAVESSYDKIAGH